MDIFAYGFMQRAFLAGLIVAIICPLVGIFIVIRRQSLLGDGLGHIAFAGVTGASLLKIYPPIGAAALTVTAAVGIELVRRRQNRYTDMILALFFYTGLALAVIFSTLSKMPSTGLLSFLFGSILTVTWEDIYLISGAAVVVIAIMKRLSQPLLLASFDEEVAKVSGINTDRLNMIFAVMTALVVVMGMTVVGILLISALMIVPVAAAHLWQRGFYQTLGLALFYSLSAVFVGLFTAFTFDMATGGTIVITAIIFYILTYIVTGIFIKDGKK